MLSSVSALPLHSRMAADIITHLPSDSDDEGAAAVDAIVSQAMDEAALEDAAAVITSTALPTALESRFRKLKSFPAASPKLPRTPPPIETLPPPSAIHRCHKGPTSPREPPAPQVVSEGAVVSSRVKSRGGSEPVPSPLIRSISSRDSPSPPRKPNCCFAFSPKRPPTAKKGSGRRKKKGLGFGIGDGDEDLGVMEHELLSDLGTFSLKEQERKMKMAIQEQEEVIREAEEVVKWVKQASARMEYAAVDDMLSDEEELK